jgi:NAD(P)-dependent dehydrogenase (short-subunit alcohol dehydrogenase family)
MSSPNAGKVAIVTGASSGIGRATSIALCRAGWKLVLSARREAELKETARMCAEAAGVSDDYNKVTFVSVGDVTKEGDVKRLFEEGVNAFGKRLIRSWVLLLIQYQVG